MSRYTPVDRGGSPGQLLQHTADPQRWLARVFLGRDANGKRRYVSETIYGRKRDAERRLTQLLQHKNEGQLTPRSNLTLADLVKEWIAHKAKEVSPRTLRGYQQNLEYYALPTLGHVRVSNITLREIDALYTNMMNGTLPTPATDGSGWQGQPLSARTVRLTHAALSQALAHGVRHRIIPFNPAAEASLPSLRNVDDATDIRERRTLSVTERARFLTESSSAFYRVLYQLLMDTGMRPGEACALEWTDIDFESERITINKAVTRGSDGSPVVRGPKNRFSRRTIPLFGLREILLEHHRWQVETNLNASGRVFTTQEGTPLTPWTHNRRELGRILTAANISGKFTLYSFRHTFATLHLDSGTPLKVVSEWLGHSNIQQTANTYQHLSSDVSEDWARKHVAFLAESAKAEREAMLN